MRAAYLDYNATAPIRPEAIAAVMEALAEPGNPSSVHGQGRRARNRLESARAVVATAVGAQAEQVIFTSGATEANALALVGVSGLKLVSAVEHPSILENAPGARHIPVDHQGRICLDALEEQLARERPALVALMAANNETGVLQPVAEAARLVHAAGALLHVDAAQVVGRLPFTLGSVGADLVSLSGHKLGGPPGVGALVLARDLELATPIRGGGQERRRRPGTENLPGIAGMAAALVQSTDWRRVEELRDRLEAEVQRLCPDALIAGAAAARLPNTSCIVTPGVGNEAQLIALDLDGVCVSAGAACSSGKVTASHVLLAMGLPRELARCAIRVSLGWANTENDIDRFLNAYGRLVERVRPSLARRVA